VQHAAAALGEPLHRPHQRVLAIHAGQRDQRLALLPWFFLTPILWSLSTLPSSAQSHERLIKVLEWGNFIAPPIAALRDALWSGHAPRAADVVYLSIAALVALVVGSLVFRRIDDRLAIVL